MKICTKCGISKNEDQFSKRGDGSTSLKSCCKLCAIVAFKKFSAISKSLGKCVQCGKGADKTICAECSLKKSLEQKDRRSRRKDKRLCVRCGAAIFSAGLISSTRCSKCSSYHSGRMVSYVINNLVYRLRNQLRGRIVHALNGNFKSGSAVQDLGCTIPELKKHLESQFKPDMTWDNWGHYGWHIDHIKPLASFDLTDRAQFLRANHYTNLQPLWWWENLSKGSRNVSS